MYSNFKPLGIFWNCPLGLYSSNTFYIQYVLVDFETFSPNLTAISQPYTPASQVTRRQQLALKRESQEKQEDDGKDKPARGRGRGKGKGRGRGKQPKQPKVRASGHKNREEDQDEMDDKEDEEEEEEEAPAPPAAAKEKTKEAGKKKKSVKPKKETLATDDGKVKKPRGEKKAGQVKTQANRMGEEDVEDAMMEDMQDGDEVPKSTSESDAMLSREEEEKHEGIGVPNGKEDCDEEEVVDEKDSRNAVKVDVEKGTPDEKQDETPREEKPKRRRLRKISDNEPPEDKKSNEKTEDKWKKTDAPAEENVMPEKEKEKTQDLQPEGRKNSRTRGPMVKGKGENKRVLESETGASKADKAAAKKTKEEKKDPKPEAAVRKRRTGSVDAKKAGGHEVDHGAEPKEEEDLSKAKCFAKRRCPKTGFNRAKWVSLRKVFEEKLKPYMTTYSKAEDRMGYKFGRAGGLEDHFPIRPHRSKKIFPKDPAQ